LDRLVSWAKENGMFISDKIGFSVNDFGVYTYAKEAIPNTEILFACPAKVRLAEEIVVMNQGDREYDEYYSYDKLDKSGITSQEHRLALLLIELKLSNNPYWAPYIGIHFW
jgi:hypothetical protein